MVRRPKAFIATLNWKVSVCGESRAHGSEWGEKPVKVLPITTLTLLNYGLNKRMHFIF